MFLALISTNFVFKLSYRYNTVTISQNLVYLKFFGLQFNKKYFQLFLFIPIETFCEKSERNQLLKMKMSQLKWNPQQNVYKGVILTGGKLLFNLEAGENVFKCWGKSTFLKFYMFLFLHFGLVAQTNIWHLELLTSTPVL